MRIAGRRRIQEYAALQKRPMKIRYQRADVTRAIAPAESLAAQLLQEILVVTRKVLGVCFVHRINGSTLGHANVFMAEDISANRRIECEAEDAVAGRVNQHGRRPIDDVTGGNLFSASLQDG